MNLTHFFNGVFVDLTHFFNGVFLVPRTCSSRRNLLHSVYSIVTQMSLSNVTFDVTFEINVRDKPVLIERSAAIMFGLDAR